MNAPLPSLHFAAPYTAAPRFRTAGDLTLDQVHRDARVDDIWLGLQPREFAVLWRLAEQPGEPIGDAALVAGLRAKLAAVGLAEMLSGDDATGYVLETPEAPL